jgi:glucose-6-phosphate 1-epimerase
MAGQHGFARTRKWTIGKLSESSAKMTLKHSEDSLKLWPFRFELEYEVSLLQNSLICSFSVKNCDTISFDFTALLHTYFAIGNISSVRIEGLQGLRFRDKLHDFQEFSETRSIIDNINGEIDRNYLNVPGKVCLHSENAKIELSSDFKDLVVWNPWIEKSKAMADFDDAEVHK